MNTGIVCLACVAVLAGSAVASAQVTGGVKVGLNAANMSVSQAGISNSPGNREALVAGGFLEIPVVRRVAIQPEALFTMKGSESSFNVPGVSGSSVVKLTSLDVPVLLRVDVLTHGTVIPYAYAGPNIGFLLSAKSHATVSGTVHDEDIKGDLKNTEFGIAVGGGVRFGRLLAEVRYTHGLTNVLTDTASGGGVKITNHAIAVIGGARF